MRALVLSGGEGSRLRPITSTNAKQLIPVAGTPILFQALEAISAAGITEVGIVTGSTGDEVRAAVGDGSQWGIDVTFIPQEAPLGIAHAVMTAEGFLAGEPFLLYLGDNVLLGGVTRFIAEFEHSEAAAHILLARVSEPEHFGVAVLDGDSVVRLVEKPREHLSDLALVGVYLFRGSILDACRTLEPSGRGEYEITEAIQWLIDEGREVRAEMVSGYWKDTGRPEDLLEANRMMLGTIETSIDGSIDAATTIEGPVIVRSGAVVTDSLLRGPLVIGEGSTVDRSVIGPDVSIGPQCRIGASEVADSIVMEECTIAEVRGLVGSILGRRVEVRHSGGSGAHRLIVGDQSQIEVD
ncbi:MAG: glucose-1-phosphate thymidylyltransferase [Actinomycetota bacterium]|nr:glucose-1-phosphate thymidylyltransferase [Actinomycetota bacterium]MDH5313374.1 glucose-1-phosphate thymidylyltransferase [Actinomycetota bacterium]